MLVVVFIIVIKIYTHQISQLLNAVFQSKGNILILDIIVINLYTNQISKLHITVFQSKERKDKNDYLLYIFI